MFNSLFIKIGITLTMWIIARLIPSFLNTFINDQLINFIIYIVMLPLGWCIAKLLSRNKQAKCLKANLLLFIVIESVGLLSTITGMLQQLAFSTGRYTTDWRGVAYSEYPIIIILLLVFEIVYISICVYLYKKSTNKIDEVIDTQLKSQSISAENIENQKDILKEEMSKIRKDIQLCDESFNENSKILAESFSDDQLYIMIKNGEFPKKYADEYMNERKRLQNIISFLPSARQSMIDRLAELSKQLIELEFQNNNYLNNSKYEGPVFAEPILSNNKIKTHMLDEDGDLILYMEDGSEFCYYDFPKNLYHDLKHTGNPIGYIQKYVQGQYQCEKIN